MNRTAKTNKPMTRGVRSPRWALNQTMLIPCRDGIPYLFRRRIIQTPWFGIFLHDIFQPDTDADPHDHPWSFLSFIVRGSYIERLYPDKNDLDAYEYHRWNRFTVHRMGRDSAHRIVEADPNLKTLIFTGPRRKSWGFYTSEGYVPWQEYEKR